MDASFVGEALGCVRGDRPVFAGLSFGLAAGAALLLTGANGSGKSSLIRLMAGLGRPAAGRILWNGADIADDREAHAARLRYLGHLDAVKPELSVEENLAGWLRLAGAGAEAGPSALAEFDLAALARFPARILSAGQKRRLALARTFAAPPAAALWLLDEPTIALDGAGVAALGLAIARVRAGAGIVVVSTNVAFALPGAAVLDVSRFASPAHDAEAA